MSARGSYRNLGDPEPLRTNAGLGPRVNKGPGPRHALGTAGANDEHMRYRWAKVSQARREGGRESERPIVPTKPGNQPEGPGGGKGAPGHDTVGGKDGRNADF